MQHHKAYFWKVYFGIGIRAKELVELTNSFYNIRTSQAIIQTLRKAFSFALQKNQFLSNPFRNCFSVPCFLLKLFNSQNQIFNGLLL
jgi:hypothetical protein